MSGLTRTHSVATVLAMTGSRRSGQWRSHNYYRRVTK